MDAPEMDILSLAEYENLEVIEKYGKAATITDLCILEGGLVDDEQFIREDRTLKGRASFFWTKTRGGHNNNVMDVFGKTGMAINSPQDWSSRAIRPVIRNSALFTMLYPSRTKGYNGVEEVEYGEYPQDVVNARKQRELDSVLERGMLEKTGKVYTFNSVPHASHEHNFEPINYHEIRYKGKKYLHVKANTSYGSFPVKLSNCKKYSNGDYAWIEVSPVKWLIDEKEKILISKKGLIAGIRFLDKNTTYDGDFNKTDLKAYIDNYLVKDLTQSAENISKKELTEIEKKELEEKQKKELEKGLEEIREKEKERLILAQQKLRELSEILKDTSNDISIDRLRIDNLRSIIFKNDGKPTEKGYIEFDDFFRNNKILRIIDLSDLDLDNVDITNMDFSGTNIHIDPQVIHDKDMTGVNALDIQFSPFMDSFNDVILDGAKINDQMALIDLDKARSYNDETVIEKEVSNKKH